jgi:transketolase
MRDAFAKELLEIAQTRPDVYLLVGDIGHGVFDEFRASFPDRFINMGIAEQNMVGVAAGMALEGKRPIVYTIATFGTMRCYEQIRNDVCLHNLPVTIVGVGAGLSYGALGPTHHAIEDIAIMRAMPGMDVYAPIDPEGVRKFLNIALNNAEPVYLRLGKNGEPELKFEWIVGGQVLVLGCGPIFKVAQEAADILSSQGVRCVSYPVEKLKPFNQQWMFQTSRVVVTLEEHSVIGGLGSIVAEALAEIGHNKKLLRLGIPDKFISTVGDRDYLLKELNLTPDGVAQTIMDLLLDLLLDLL